MRLDPGWVLRGSGLGRRDWFEDGLDVCPVLFFLLPFLLEGWSGLLAGRFMWILARRSE